MTIISVWVLLILKIIHKTRACTDGESLCPFNLYHSYFCKPRASYFLTLQLANWLWASFLRILLRDMNEKDRNDRKWQDTTKNVMKVTEKCYESDGKVTWSWLSSSHSTNFPISTIWSIYFCIYCFCYSSYFISAYSAVFASRLTTVYGYIIALSTSQIPSL